MRDGHLTITFHWPHDRFLLGTEYIGPDDSFNGSTYKLFLLIATLELNIECDE